MTSSGQLIRRSGARRFASWRSLFILAMLVGFVGLAGCTAADSDDAANDTSNGGSDEGSSTVGDSSAENARASRELKPTIRLAVTDWTAARLNASIAEQLIERRLGYPVEQIAVIDTGAMLNDLAAGEIDAVLEVWPSSLDASDLEMIAAGRVDDIGELGVTGKTGWFVPRYVIRENGDLADWEAYADRSVAADFATAETGTSGRFLGTDTNYEQFDEDIIDALDLPFEVVFSGSDEATASELSKAEAAGEPVLLFWWTPTAEVAKFDLVNVSLPERTSACESEIEAGLPQRCDYPTDRLKKLASPMLRETIPEIFLFLERFSLTTNDQLLMVDQVENKGRSVDEVAAAWVDENQGRWEAWTTDG